MQIYTPTSHPKGFTIIELTIAMLVGLMIATTSLALFSNQLVMFDSLKKQNFMLHKAPQINSLLNKIIPRADAFQMFASTANLNDSAGVIEDAKVLALRFRKDEQNLTYAVIAFDPSTKDLNYYNNLNKPTDLDPNNPSWKIASNVNDVTFYVETGIIRIKVTGDDQQEIIFSSTTR